nr:MAG TPA: hypothetical protein [Caudoviricetes sp.]
MWCMLKSQIDGKPFLVTAINNEKDIESRYKCKDWYLGMIAQVEAEEALKGRSEI